MYGTRWGNKTNVFYNCCGRAHVKHKAVIRTIRERKRKNRHTRWLKWIKKSTDRNQKKTPDGKKKWRPTLNTSRDAKYHEDECTLVARRLMTRRQNVMEQKLIDDRCRCCWGGENSLHGCVGHRWILTLNLHRYHGSYLRSVLPVPNNG
jgi:hypothetical protein